LHPYSRSKTNHKEDLNHVRGSEQGRNEGREAG
jgi:hypothetical protein